MTDNTIKISKGANMDSLTIIKDELDRIDEARAKAAEGIWVFGSSVDKRRGTVFVEGRADIHHYSPDQPSGHYMWKHANAEFIALAANEITKLTKALSVAVEALEDANHGFSKSGLRYGGMQYEQISAKALTTIANILSGGKDGKE